MNELKMYVVSWWSFKAQKALVKSFRYRKSAVKFAVKLAEDTDTNFRTFTEYKGITPTEEFSF